MRRPHGEGGFTLLELMVALVVLGSIIAALAGSTQFGFAASRNQDRVVAEHQDLQPIDQVLRRLVAGMALPNDPASPALAGDAAALSCITQAPQGARSPPALVDAVLGLDHQHRLVLLWSPHVHAERLQPRPPPQQGLLLEGLRKLVISYLSPDRTGWMATWSAPGLPALIRFELVFAPEDGRRWPPIIAATLQRRRSLSNR